jgi:hypothetical protein
MISFTFQLAGADVPAGSYYAEYIGVEDYEGGEYGPGVKWSWRITSGEHKDKVISRITGKKPTAGNACGRMIVSLLGKTPGLGEPVDLSACVGKKYVCTMAKAPKSEGCRVETVALLP